VQRCTARFVWADFFGEKEVDMTNAPPPPAWPSPPGAGQSPKIYRYGGFWIRVVAALIDGIVLTITFAVIGAVSGLDFFSSDPEHFDSRAVALQVVLNWLYEALLTSSERGATLGKMAVGLRIVTEQGERLSFLRATGRYFAKYVSALILGVGFLMVAFTDRKRGLHDMIAGTVVIKTD
jgi:uncharacterized RDD family membrane protein YckC